MVSMDLFCQSLTANKLIYRIIMNLLVDMSGF